MNRKNSTKALHRPVPPQSRHNSIVTQQQRPSSTVAAATQSSVQSVDVHSPQPSEVRDALDSLKSHTLEALKSLHEAEQETPDHVGAPVVGPHALRSGTAVLFENNMWRVTRSGVNYTVRADSEYNPEMCESAALRSGTPDGDTWSDATRGADVVWRAGPTTLLRTPSMELSMDATTQSSLAARSSNLTVLATPSEIQVTGGGVVCTLTKSTDRTTRTVASGEGKLCMGDSSISGAFVDGLLCGPATLAMGGDANLVVDAEWAGGQRHGQIAIRDRSSGALIFSGSFEGDAADGIGDWIVSRGPSCKLNGRFTKGLPTGELSLVADDGAAVVARISVSRNETMFNGAAGKFKGTWTLRTVESLPSTAVTQLNRRVDDRSVTHREVCALFDNWARLQRLGLASERYAEAARLNMDAVQAALRASIVAGVAQSVSADIDRSIAEMRGIEAAAQSQKKKELELIAAIERAKTSAASDRAAAERNRKRTASCISKLEDLKRALTTLDEEASATHGGLSMDAILVETKLAEGRLASAAKRLACARLAFKNAKALRETLQKRLDAQTGLSANLEKQLEIAEAARDSAARRHEETKNEYNRKILVEEGRIAEQRLQLERAEESLNEAKRRTAEVERELQQIRTDDSTSENIRASEALLEERRASLAALEQELQQSRDDRDRAAADLARLHADEKNLHASLKSHESQVEAAREALRKRRLGVEELEARVEALESDAAAAAAVVAGGLLNKDDTEESLLARHRRSVACFEERLSSTRCELEALRKTNESILAQQLEADAVPTGAPSQENSLLCGASPSAVPRVAETPLSEEDEQRIADLTRRIAQVNAAAETAASEIRRLKELKGAPVWLAINAPACTTAELRVLQTQIRSAISAADEETAALQAKIALLKGQQQRGIEARTRGGRRESLKIVAGIDWRIKTLQEVLERRDNRIAELKAQVSRIKQLEAKLAVASDTVDGMSASVEARQQQSLSKQRSDSDWAAARSVALLRHSSSSGSLPPRLPSSMRL